MYYDSFSTQTTGVLSPTQQLKLNNLDFTIRVLTLDIVGGNKNVRDL